MVASFGHSQSSGAHEQDFISHLGQAGNTNKSILHNKFRSIRVKSQYTSYA